MKTILTFFLLFSIIGAAYGDPAAQVVLRQTASVSGDYFTLGDIATVTSKDTTYRFKLLNATMGRAPLPGLTRPFNSGNVALKLRQAGFDPESMSISGASDMLLVGAGGSIAAEPAAAVIAPEPVSATTTAVQAVQIPQSAPNTPRTIVIHRGESVTLVYDSDGMSISADVIANCDGAVGDSITLRREGAVRPLNGIVQDAQTVKMVE